MKTGGALDLGYVAHTAGKIGDRYMRTAPTITVIGLRKTLA
jgi:hypothetical protein